MVYKMRFVRLDNCRLNKNTGKHNYKRLYTNILFKTRWLHVSALKDQAPYEAKHI